MRRALALCAMLAMTLPAARARADGPNKVTVYRDAKGFKLRVDGRDTMVFGMNWGYMPIGENYTYSLWTKPDALIKAALAPEMTLLKKMGVNVIRQYVGIPARWIAYIYKKYGIYTVLNHAVGRYGFNVDGVWQSPINYENKRVRVVLEQAVMKVVKTYKNTPGLLMWLLGNENNYGLSWSTAAVANLPKGKANKVRAAFLYSLMGKIIRAVKAEDKHHPVAIANGDLQYIDLIAKHCKGLDILGANVYRGASSGKLFDDVKRKLGLPFMYTEFGADAYNAKERREDHISQARYLRAQWQEIYEHSYGKGRAGNAIGGMTFQWSDGWWKHGQTTRLSVHDTTASWSNKAYSSDYQKNGNNMNEEWFGICAKGPNNSRGLYALVPRTAYYVLQSGCKLDPYAKGTTLAKIRKHWGAINIGKLARAYKADKSISWLKRLARVRVKNLQLRFTTFTTGGFKLDDAERRKTRFDHMQSFFVDLESKPTKNITAELSVNVIGKVATNPINEIFFENRGKPTTLLGTDNKPKTIEGLQRVKVYRASFEWDESWFKLTGFYRKGHFHWGYEGDFFNLYQQAYYGPNIDIYNADVPIGMEFTGKRGLEGLKIALGPELYWGANPTVFVKYRRKIPAIGLDFALVHQEDISQRAGAAVSVVIPQPKTRRTALYLSRKFGPFTVQLGGLMAGTTLIDRPFQRVEDAQGKPSYLNSGFFVADDKVQFVDTLGAKAKISLTAGRFNWFIQGAYSGVVSDGGGDQTLTFTGWTLKESGRGNQYHIRSGGTVNIGYLQIAPNFLYQKPLVGPLPKIGDGFDASTGTYFAGVSPRNILEDPFVVRGNQEMLGYELMIVFDPTPATFFWAFDNVRREDAKLAGSLNFVYRNYRQSQDANIGVFANGGLFTFDLAPPAEDLWEARLRLISNPVSSLRLLLDAYIGRGQSDGSDPRLIDRGGVSLRASYSRWALQGFVKFNDWGPYNFHQNFNLTFPLQLMGDISYGAVLPRWLAQTYTRFGVRGQFRTLDKNSPRFNAGADPSRKGREWEVMTYLHLTI